MTLFQEQSSYNVFLRILTPDEAQVKQVYRKANPADRIHTSKPHYQKQTFNVHLMDDQGNEQSGRFEFSPERKIATGPCWSEFLEGYENDRGITEADIQAFGDDLFDCLIYETGLIKAWNAIQTHASQSPFLMTAEFGGFTETAASLPLELLRYETGYLFARPGTGLRRTLLRTPMKPFVPSTLPKVLFAWACPPLAGDPFDPSPHIRLMEALFKDRLTVIDQASCERLETLLSEADKTGQPFDYLHIMAHGYRDGNTGGICLTSPRGMDDPVSSERLAAAVRGKGVNLAFLCSCKTAVAGLSAFSGVGQQLLSKEGGDISCVVATQANIRVRDSEHLVNRFYSLLSESRDPAIALSRARKDAFSDGGISWSVPVLLSRPSYRKLTADPAALKDLPARRSTYQERSFETKVLDDLSRHRFITLTGLPGIGKTETGKEIAREARAIGLFPRIIFQDILPEYTLSRTRSLIATAMGHTSIEDDLALAALLSSLKERILLLIDNAEDLMQDGAAEIEFREFINALLAHAPNLTILMTTRWIIEGTAESQITVDVPPMTDEEISELLTNELTHKGVFQPEWHQNTSWSDLVSLIDGHPRTLRLVSGHFRSRFNHPAIIVKKLKEHETDAIVEYGLFGRKDKFESLDTDQRARLRSLAISMKFSFGILRDRHPEATELYMALSLFPDGLPHSVIIEVAGGIEMIDTTLEPIYRYNIAAWQQDRTFYPIPLFWYANHMRKKYGIDHDKFMIRALKAFAVYTEQCDHEITSGSILTGVEKLLSYEKNLLTINEWVEKQDEPVKKQSYAARVSQAVQNGYKLMDKVGTARKLAITGLKKSVETSDKQGEANCLQSLGDLKIRVDDLDGARQDYEQALPIYREIKARLGEANCLKSLGDLKIRVDDLDGARQDYEQALPIYREIKDRLGEANCLQSQGLLYLQYGVIDKAFARFKAVGDIYAEIQDRQGVQSSLGYMARATHAAECSDQALLISDISLNIGREINDRFGQSITLRLQAEILQQSSENGIAAIALVVQLRELCGQTGEYKAENHYESILDQIREQIGAEEFQKICDNAEDIRKFAVAMAHDRFEKTGRKLFDPPNTKSSSVGL